jgi:hypothetical protein
LDFYVAKSFFHLIWKSRYTFKLSLISLFLYAFVYVIFLKHLISICSSFVFLHLSVFCHLFSLFMLLHPLFFLSFSLDIASFCIFVIFSLYLWYKVFYIFYFFCLSAWLVYSAAIYVRHEEESGLLRLLPIAAGFYDLGNIYFRSGLVDIGNFLVDISRS